MGRATEGISYFNTKTQDHYSLPIVDQIYSRITVTPQMKSEKRKYLKGLRDEAKLQQCLNSSVDVPY